MQVCRRRHYYAWLADGFGALPEKIRLTRKDGRAHFFGDRNHGLEQGRSAGIRPLAPEARERRTTWNVQLAVQAQESRLADRS